jgi:hypothetical protein
VSPLPTQPFLTKDFSPDGGGIDFLGLRYVNLHIVGNNLISELNNVTRDMGMFLLGAWIPWKFAQICEKREFTEKNYRIFKERIEVAISLTMRDESSAQTEHGQVRNRVGITQQCKLPCELDFKGAGRSKDNSLYGAAIYGPAISYLNLIDSYRAQAEGNHVIKVPVAAVDADTASIVQAMDESMASAPAYGALVSLRTNSFSWEDVDKLGQAGLCPSVYRSSEFDAIKPCFQRKLLPDDPELNGYARTRTARLLLDTLRQRAPLRAEEVRNIWYTGLFDDGTQLKYTNPDMNDQCASWSYFMARQYQRYAIELFLWCFEIALQSGERSIEGAVNYWDDRTKQAGASLDGTFRDLLKDVAGDLLEPDDDGTSENWNSTVHAGHEQLEYVDGPQTDSACLSGLRMFAGWYWRMLSREKDTAHKSLMELGSSERMGMGWFLEWLRSRQNMQVRTLLKDVFSDLVFSQHMRVALSRFDGHSQRLRFVLGDSGIEPTVSAKKDMGNRGLPWMPDRLDTLVDLLCDIDVLTLGDNDEIALGPRADTVQ